jgi:hypothetical protein
MHVWRMSGDLAQGRRLEASGISLEVLRDRAAGLVREQVEAAPNGVADESTSVAPAIERRVAAHSRPFVVGDGPRNALLRHLRVAEGLREVTRVA